MSYGIDSILVGKCSKCGGPVTLPKVWMGTQHPTPRCESCHASAKPKYGPTIEMDDPPDMKP